MCVMQWIIYRTNKKNKLMLKTEDVLVLMKLEPKACYMLKSYLQM